MADELVIVPSDGDGYVHLARTRTGRLFKKHLLNLGNLRHPATGKIIKVDDEFVTKLKTNFNNKVCDIVQVPLANDKNEHTEDPERNIGEVVDIQVENKKLYAFIDVRDDKHAEKMGKTYLGASAMMHLDYTDTNTGKKVGPTLLHACVTNRPYVTGLEDYQEIVAATSDTSNGAVLLTTETETVDTQTPEDTEMSDESKTAQETKPSLEELLTALKNDHNIDVAGLQAKASEQEQAANLSKTLVDALTAAGVVKLSNDDNQVPSTETVVGAVAQLADKNVALTDRVNRLERQDAENAVQNLINEGRILPAQKNAFVELKLSNENMFDQLVPEQPIVKLSDEKLVTPPKDKNHVEDIDKEIDRLFGLTQK